MCGCGVSHFVHCMKKGSGMSWIGCDSDQVVQVMWIDSREV
jgi:hypothetical protein